MKHNPQDSMFAFMLVAIAVPTVLVGVLTVSAASDVSVEAKSTYHELFNLRSFRIQQRMNRQSQPASTVESETHPAAKTLAPCAPTDTSTTKTEKPARPLIFEDLDMHQRETLRKQLRIGGCPQDVDPAYRQLCESLLKKQKRPETKAGLKHPEQ